MTNRDVALAREGSDCQNCRICGCFNEQSLDDANNFVKGIRVWQPDVHEIERHSCVDVSETANGGERRKNHYRFPDGSFVRGFGGSKCFIVFFLPRFLSLMGFFFVMV